MILAFTGTRRGLTPAQRAALKMVLLFHSSSPWDDTKRLRWLELAGTSEATTKTLCDAIRKALG